jgi:hypothetical protein
MARKKKSKRSPMKAEDRQRIRQSIEARREAMQTRVAYSARGITGIIPTA